LEDLNSTPAHNSQSPANGSNVAVVGGSAAGLLTASVLARRGVPVRVFERIENLEPPERTLIVTHRMRSLLGPAAETAFGPGAARLTAGRIASTEFELHGPLATGGAAAAIASRSETQQITTS